MLRAERTGTENDAVSSEEREFMVSWRIHVSPWQSGDPVGSDGLAGAGRAKSREGAVGWRNGFNQGLVWGCRIWLISRRATIRQYSRA